jgi:uncharacterized repeat protein (TIGR03806 family)
MPVPPRRHAPLALICLALIAAGCGPSGGETPVRTSDSPRDLKDTFRPPRAPRLPGVPHTFPREAPGGGSGDLRVDRAFPSLTFGEPLFLTHAPDGSDRIFVVTKPGIIHVFPNRDDAAQSQFYLDITDRVNAEHEFGLLGMAFDPDYRTSGYFYVHYVDRSHQSRIARFRVTSDPDRADPSSEHTILALAQPETNHNGGMIAFGPDGMLYIAFGDGGGLDDQYDNGQNRNTLLGDMLRIDPRRPSGGRAYTIPGDNPFVGQPGRAEVWAMGLRSPWRFSFDRETGDLWLGDVGQDTCEELDLIRRGGNYAWPVYEGNVPLRNPHNRPPTDFDQPLLVPSRADCRSIIGGYVYRGARMPSFVGHYFYGDYAYGTIWALRQQNGSVTSNRQVGALHGVASFGEDQHGELYAVSLDQGTIHRLAERGGGGGAAIPRKLSDTGLLTHTGALAWHEGLIPYDVNNELWSDGVMKRRLFSIPLGHAIGFDPTEAWRYPVGSVLVKHFELPLDVGSPWPIRRLETRVLVRHASSWGTYTYKWNDQQDDAELLAAREDAAYVIRDRYAQGGTRVFPWTYPGPADCLQCHTAAAGHVLGHNTLQTNRTSTWLGPGVNQVDQWNAMSLFDRDVGAAEQYQRLSHLHDVRVPLRDRARSYLAANCAQCHRPGGVMQGDMDLRFTTSDAGTRTVWVRPTRGDLGIPDAFRIRPGSPDTSVLWERMRRLDGTRMPGLGTHAVDLDALLVVGEWILGL